LLLHQSEVEFELGRLSDDLFHTSCGEIVKFVDDDACGYSVVLLTPPHRDPLQESDDQPAECRPFSLADTAFRKAEYDDLPLFDSPFEHEGGRSAGEFGELPTCKEPFELRFDGVFRYGIVFAAETMGEKLNYIGVVVAGLSEFYEAAIPCVIHEGE
jgi:hypothetical protein